MKRSDRATHYLPLANLSFQGATLSFPLHFRPAYDLRICNWVTVPWESRDEHVV